MDEREQTPAPSADDTNRTAGAPRTPLLSIGLPVYNGAGHLREALESLVAQDVDDFELVICDNASTDDTPRICAEFAERDPRVRYVRNETNIGAAANFNRAFELCSGSYFMWASHDDVWEPSFASACIARLQAHPRAVLCTSLVRLIDDQGRTRPEHYETMDTEGMTLEERIHELFRRQVWYDMYSVVRPESVRQTHGYAPSFGGDVHFFLELLLLGDFLTVPETLFSYRIPDTLKTTSEQASEIGVDEATKEQHEEPWSFLARDLARVVEESDLDAETVGRIHEDFVETMSRKDSSWGRAILRERGWVFFPPEWVTRDEIRATIEPKRPLTPSQRAVKQAQVWTIRVGRRVKAAGRALRRLLRPPAGCS